jgi:hypothetical protein
MHIADLAKELKITESYINDKIKSLKLRSKNAGELTAGVEMILRDALADEGIGQKVADEPEQPKKPVKKAKIPAKTTDKPKVKKPKPAPARKKTALEADDESTAQAPKPELPKPEVSKREAAKPEIPRQEVPKPEAPKHEVPKPEAPKHEVPKPEAPKVVPVPVAKVPVIDVTKIEIPKEILPIDPTKKKVRYDQPFIAVKPLAKKRKRSFEDASGAWHGRDHKPSLSIASAVVPEVQPAGPLVEIEMPIPISVKDFAVRVNQKMNVVLKKLLNMGVFANINQNLGEELVVKLANSFGFNVIKSKTQEEELIDVVQQKDDPQFLKPRAPVVTLWGMLTMVKHPCLTASAAPRWRIASMAGSPSISGLMMSGLPMAISHFWILPAMKLLRPCGPAVRTLPTLWFWSSLLTTGSCPRPKKPLPMPVRPICRSSWL